MQNSIELIQLTVNSFRNYCFILHTFSLYILKMGYYNNITILEIQKILTLCYEKR